MARSLTGNLAIYDKDDSTMSEILIRNYQPQDWSRIEQIHDSARIIELNLAGLEDAFVPLAQAAVGEGLFDYKVCVALIQNDLAGFLAYSEDEIAWLYVCPRLMRQGVAKSLVAHALKNIVVRPIKVEVLVGNAPAMRFYESMGFKTSELCSGAMPGNDSFQVTVHCMERQA